MQRAREILSPEGEIAHRSEDERRRLLQEETIVVEFEPERAKQSWPKLFRSNVDRRHAHALLDRIDDAHVPLDARQRHLVSELRGLLPLHRAGNGGKAPTPKVRRELASTTRSGATNKGRTARA